MGLDERMTLTELAKHAVKTADGRSMYVVVIFAALSCALALLSEIISPRLINPNHISKICEISALSIVTTPIIYLGLAYFSACGRFSEVKNAIIIITMNAYIVYRGYF